MDTQVTYLVNIEKQMTLYKIEDNRMFGGHGLVVISESLPKARRLFLEAYAQMCKKWYDSDEWRSTTYRQLRNTEEVRESVHELNLVTYADGSSLNLPPLDWEEDENGKLTHTKV